jgi:hypothetical protein
MSGVTLREGDREQESTVDRDVFEQRLRTAARLTVEFGRRFVRQSLPDAVAFRVYPNQSYDDNPRVGDEVVFPDDSLPEGRSHGPWSAAEVVALLWRDGKVPEWIDAVVEAEDGTRSVIGLRCCGRFTAQEELLYHRYPNGVPPFSIKGPSFPIGWESVEVSGKFDLYWQEAVFGGRRSGPCVRRLCLLRPINDRFPCGLVAWLCCCSGC